MPTDASQPIDPSILVESYIPALSCRDKEVATVERLATEIANAPDPANGASSIFHLVVCDASSPVDLSYVLADDVSTLEARLLMVTNSAESVSLRFLIFKNQDEIASSADEGVIELSASAVASLPVNIALDDGPQDAFRLSLLGFDLGSSENYSGIYTSTALRFDVFPTANSLLPEVLNSTLIGTETDLDPYPYYLVYKSSETSGTYSLFLSKPPQVSDIGVFFYDTVNDRRASISCGGTGSGLAVILSVAETSSTKFDCSLENLSGNWADLTAAILPGYSDAPDQLLPVFVTPRNIDQ